MAEKGYVLLPGEGRALEMGPFRMTVKADSSGTEGGLTLLEAAEPAGFGPPMHVHDDAGEAFYVLEGEYLVVIEGAEHRCPAGSFVYVPKGVEHGFRVGGVPSRKLNIYVPSAMEHYFAGLHAAAVAGRQLDDGQLAALAAASAMRVTGPVPDGYV
jgi:mannose-6-phosphate isomerase-like protein (cupin superfamily)